MLDGSPGSHRQPTLCEAAGRFINHLRPWLWCSWTELKKDNTWKIMQNIFNTAARGEGKKCCQWVSEQWAQKPVVFLCPSILSRRAVALTVPFVPGCLSELWTAPTLWQSQPLAAFQHDCQILSIDSPGFNGTRNRPSTDGSFASLSSSLADWLADHLGDKLLPQQFQDVVRVLVSLSAHPTQLHGLQVGVRRDVEGRAVEFSQSEPHSIWVHLD